MEIFCLDCGRDYPIVLTCKVFTACKLHLNKLDSKKKKKIKGGVIYFLIILWMIDASYIQSGNWNLVESKKADFDMIQIETKIKNVKKKKKK